MTNYEWLLQMGGEQRQAWFDAQHVDGMSLKPVRNPETYAGEEDSRERLENDIAWEYAQVGFGPNMDEVIGWLDRQAAITANELVSLSVDEDSPVKGESDTAESRIRNFDADSREKLEADANDAENPTDSFMDSCDYKDGELTIDGAYFADSREKLEDEIYERSYHVYDTLEMRMGEGHWQVDVPRSMVFDWLDRQAAITERECAVKFIGRQNGKTPEYMRVMREMYEQIAELTAERDALADDLLTCNKEREHYRELFSESLTLAAEIVNLQP